MILIRQLPAGRINILTAAATRRRVRTRLILEELALREGLSRRGLLLLIRQLATSRINILSTAAT